MFFFNLLRRIFRLESSNSLKFPPLVSHSLIGKTTGPNPGTDPAVKSTNRMVYLNYMQIIRSVLKSVGIFKKIKGLKVRGGGEGGGVRRMPPH